MRSLFFVFIFLFSSSLHAADDKVVVTATRLAVPKSDLPFSVNSISGPRLDQSGGKIENALSTVPGLNFAVHGGPGQTRSLFIRGSKSEHVLVLIDGIPVNDPLAPSRAFDFAQIPIDDIDRIEVIKGPQSVLYGSDAMGGVVQIFSKRDLKTRARLEAGSYRTVNARLSHMGFRAGYTETKGFSAADEREGNKEKDGQRAWNIGGSKDFPVTENFLIRLNAQYKDSRTDTDKSGGPLGDSYNTYSQQYQFLLREENLILLSNDAELSIAGNYSSNDREDTTNGNDYYKAYLWKAEAVYRHPNLGMHSLTAGTEYSEEAGLSNQTSGGRRKFRIGAFFLQDQLKDGPFHATLGARLDLHSESGSTRTYRAGVGYWIIEDWFRMKGSVGTGFKNPSLYQSYSTFGSPHLAPEESLGGEAGIEFQRDEWSTELTYFAQRFRNQIDFNQVALKYFNQARAETSGVEWALERRFGLFHVNNALTYLCAYDPATGLALLRRPRWTNTLEFGFTRPNHYGANLRARYVGKREDTFSLSPYPRQPMPAFVTVGLDAFHTLSETLRITARGENILDRRYQETSGFGTPGVSGYLGLEADL